jgi:signal transduction histidine kinase
MKRGLASLESIKDLASNLSQTIGEVRRIMTDLRPSILDDLGILSALSWLCREFEATYSHICVEKRIGISEEQVPDALKIVIFRISQEAMNNIAKHSDSSRIQLCFQKAQDRVELTIQDNGRGSGPMKSLKGLVYPP